MDLKANVKHSFARTTQMFDAILETIKSEEHWFYQPTKKANHPLWIIGHLGLAANMFAEKFAEGTSHIPEGWEELFWFGSEIKEDRNVYPNSTEVVSYFRERRTHLLSVLDGLSDEQLDAAPPADTTGILEGAPSLGHAFLFANFHEGMHLGQLTVCHRGLGHDPIYAPKPATA